MVVSDDYIQAMISGPVERFVCAYAAVHTDHQLVSIRCRFFQGRLLDAIAFSEAVWHVVSRSRSQQRQSAQENRGAGSAVDIVVAVNQNRLGLINCAPEPGNGLTHSE